MTRQKFIELFESEKPIYYNFASKVNKVDMKVAKIGVSGIVMAVDNEGMLYFNYKNLYASKRSALKVYL